MKFLDEYRDSSAALKIAESINGMVSRKWRIMEVCGGQTHSIVRFGINTMLSESVDFLHGPGCPVCVTPAERIDDAITLACREEVIFCTFGDMMRVPGTSVDLMSARSRGADVRIVYSPLESLDIARQFPDKRVVFFGIGFETTAPLIAASILQADARDCRNYHVLSSLRLIPPAIEMVLSAEDRPIDALLAPGHVCTITGVEPYRVLSEKYGVPIVITGFEPVDILSGVKTAIGLLELSENDVVNDYSRSVRLEGNTEAQRIIDRVFESENAEWRGLGSISISGLKIRDEFLKFDAASEFGLSNAASADEKRNECIDVLMGRMKPEECSAFGSECSPDHPLGPLMVSSEGACAAYYRYR